MREKLEPTREFKWPWWAGEDDPAAAWWLRSAFLIYCVKKSNGNNAWEEKTPFEEINRFLLVASFQEESTSQEKVYILLWLGL